MLMIISEVNEIYLTRGEKKITGQNVTDTDIAASMCRQFWGSDIDLYESFFIPLLDCRNKPIGWAKISQGGVDNAGAIDVRIMAKYAVSALATGVIICHNHPSGSLKFSDADIKTTRQIKIVLELLDINLIDHLLITKDGYTSIIEEVIL